jgi:hypothetical protein
MDCVVVKFSQMQDGGADPELRHSVRKSEKEAGHLPDAVIRLGKHSRNKDERCPTDQLSDPFGARCPGHASNKLAIQLPLLFVCVQISPLMLNKMLNGIVEHSCELLYINSLRQSCLGHFIASLTHAPP